MAIYHLSMKAIARSGGRSAVASAAYRAAARLTNERDEVVFDVSGELADFTRAESMREWFLYQRGLDGQAPGLDGGWGTYAHPRKSGRYEMTVETVKSNVTMTKFTVRLTGVGGGPK